MQIPHRLHISVTSAQLDALKRESEDTGAPIAEIVRRAITAYLDAGSPKRSPRRKPTR